MAAGKAVKVARGIYTRRVPTAGELGGIVKRCFPHAYLDGRSAAQIYLKQELTMPLQLASSRSLPPSPYYSARRISRPIGVERQGARVLAPALAVATIEDEALAIDMLESVYKGKHGSSLLQRDLKAFRRLPSRTRALLDTAAIGADSVPERRLTRALKERGLRVENNVRIGGYRWDIFIPAHKVVVEIDGFQFHNEQRREEFIRDRWKANEGGLSGYTVLAYTGSCVKYHLDVVTRQVESACRGEPYIPEQVWLWHAFMRQIPPWELEYLEM